jgi:2,3-dihydroxyphenylpropionate 1,2-dioxygenase
MPFAAVCAAHAPLALHSATFADQKATYLAAMTRVGDWLRDFNPDLIIEFAPDHFNGFFYRLMPSFCLGIEARAIGDWSTSTGLLPVPANQAMQALQAVRAAEIDCDISYRMIVDHGFTQVLELMFGSIVAFPVIPVMINCAAPPRPTFRRVRLLGQAFGQFARASGLKVAFVGSGGLSHDPPIVKIDEAEEQTREAMIVGADLDSAARAERETRVVTAAQNFTQGHNRHLPPNPDWDRSFIQLMKSGELARVDEWTEDSVTNIAGCGGHEVRTWIAAFAALSAAKGSTYQTDIEFYDAVLSWMTGMGVVRAR